MQYFLAVLLSGRERCLVLRRSRTTGTTGWKAGKARYRSHGPRRRLCLQRPRCPLGLVGSQLERPTPAAPRALTLLHPAAQPSMPAATEPKRVEGASKEATEVQLSPHSPRAAAPLPWSPVRQKPGKLCTKRAWRAAGREENGGFWWICSGLYGLARQSG